MPTLSSKETPKIQQGERQPLDGQVLQLAQLAETVVGKAIRNTRDEPAVPALG